MVRRTFNGSSTSKYVEQALLRYAETSSTGRHVTSSTRYDAVNLGLPDNNSTMLIPVEGI